MSISHHLYFDKNVNKKNECIFIVFIILSLMIFFNLLHVHTFIRNVINFINSFKICLKREIVLWHTRRWRHIVNRALALKCHPKICSQCLYFRTDVYSNIVYRSYKAIIYALRQGYETYMEQHINTLFSTLPS